jgi:hypothetical protein
MASGSPERRSSITGFNCNGEKVFLSIFCDPACPHRSSWWVVGHTAQQPETIPSDRDFPAPEAAVVAAIAELLPSLSKEWFKESLPAVKPIENFSTTG